MKVEPFNLDRYQAGSLFVPFRERKNIITFWMEVAKTILSYVEPMAEQIEGKMIICTDKMRRVIVQSNGKTFTTSLPYSVKIVDGSYCCTLKSGIELNNKLTSEIIAALSTTSSFSNAEVLGFADDVMAVSDDPNTLWIALSELINADDGYVRFDHDPEREDGKLHPLNHIDIFFSQSATFKLGLSDRIEIEALSDLLNIKTECHYLLKEE